VSSFSVNIRYHLKEGDSGFIIGDHEDTIDSLIEILKIKYQDRLDLDKTLEKINNNQEG